MPRPMRIMARLLTLDLPAAVGHAARGAEAPLGLAADDHFALELAAIPALGLERAHRRDRALMPAVRVGPCHRRAGGSYLERALLRLRGELPVALIEEGARSATEERAADDRARDGGAAAAGGRRDQAAHRAAA